MSEPKRASPPAKGRFYRRARAVLIGFASLYALAVLLVMTPVIQTQFRHIPFLFPRRRYLRFFIVLAFFTLITSTFGGTTSSIIPKTMAWLVRCYLSPPFRDDG
jgi:hypothetical protein